MEQTTTSTEVQTASLELQVQGMTLGVLTTNAKAILEAVKVKLASYTPDKYSEANIQLAKNDKADLNAAAKKLNDERLRLEREFMKPFDEFKSVVTETCELIKTASSKIDGIVKTVDEREKQEKRKKIEELFATYQFELVPLNRIFCQEWLNKSMTLKKVDTEIRDAIAKIQGDMTVLDKIGEPDAKAYYLNCLDLNRSIAEADRIKQSRQRLEDIEAKKKQAAIPVPAPDSAPDSAPEQVASAPVAAASAPVQTAPAPAKPAEAEAVFEVVLKIKTTKTKHIKLKHFIDDNEIGYEKLS